MTTFLVGAIAFAGGVGTTLVVLTLLMFEGDKYYDVKDRHK